MNNDVKMVSFPRELSDDLAELIATQARVCGGGAYEIWEAICNGFGKPAEQHQAEPVVLPARLPQRLPQGRNLPKGYAEAWNACLDEVAKLGPLYPYADPAYREVWEKARSLQSEMDDLQAQLADRDVLLARTERFVPYALASEIAKVISASAEPNAQPITKPNDDCAICRDLGDECMTCEEQRNSSAPVERDERAAFERLYHLHFLGRDTLTDSYISNETRSLFDGWMSRAALEGSRPTVLSKCVLCDQLQADLTERDERIDTLTDDLDQAQYDKDAWKNHEESLWVQVFHGEGDDPFISAVSGAICMEELTLIQEDIVTGAEDLLEKGPGFYVFRCCHYEAHYDNVGMTEPAHWELAFESYDRFPWADEAEAMARAAKEAELIDIDDLFETPDCCFCCDTGHIIVDDTQPEYITTPCTECEKGKQIEATATSPGAQVAALMESRGEP